MASSLNPSALLAHRFFPSTVYLASSKFSLAVLGNLGFALALASYKLLLKVRRGGRRRRAVRRATAASALPPSRPTRFQH